MRFVAWSAQDRCLGLHRLIQQKQNPERNAFEKTTSKGLEHCNLTCTRTAPVTTARLWAPRTRERVGWFNGSGASLMPKQRITQNPRMTKDVKSPDQFHDHWVKIKFLGVVRSTEGRSVDSGETRMSRPLPAQGGRAQQGRQRHVGQGRLHQESEPQQVWNAVWKNVRSTDYDSR